MAEHDPRDDLPEADRAEQQQVAWPDVTEDDADLDVDPLKASEADQLDQARDVPHDDGDPDRQA